jgi:tricorn protease-like protein
MRVDGDSGEQLVKVVIDLPEPDLGVTGERVWAAPLGDDLYEIRNSPWHSLLINWGDVVRAKAEADTQWPIFIEVVRRSGHRTMHVYFSEEGREKRAEFLARFKELGAGYENNADTLYALDCPSEVDVQPILSYLESLETEGMLEYRVSES